MTDPAAKAWTLAISDDPCYNVSKRRFCGSYAVIRSLR